MPMTCLPPSLSEQSSAEQSRAVLSYRPAHWPPETRPGGQHPNARPSNGGGDPRHWIGGWDTPLHRTVCGSPQVEGISSFLVSGFEPLDQGSDGACVIVCAGGFHSCQGFGVNPHVWYLGHVSPSMCKQPFPLISSYQPFPTSVLFNVRPEANEWGESTTKVCGCYVVRFSMFSNFYPLDWHNKTRVALPNLSETSANIELKIEPSLFQLWFSRKCMFVDYLIGYIGPFNYVNYRV